MVYIGEVMVESAFIYHPWLANAAVRLLEPGGTFCGRPDVPFAFGSCMAHLIINSSKVDRIYRYYSIFLRNHGIMGSSRMGLGCQFPPDFCTLGTWGPRP